MSQRQHTFAVTTRGHWLLMGQRKGKTTTTTTTTTTTSPRNYREVPGDKLFSPGV